MGDHDVPNATDAAALLQEVKDVVAKLRVFGVTLAADKRKKLLHQRRGAEPHIELVINLAVKYGVTVPGLPIQSIRNDLSLIELLAPFAAELLAGSVLIEHTQARAEHEAWDGFLAYYSALQSFSARVPDVAVELSPVKEFMSVRRAKEASDEATTAGGGTTATTHAAASSAPAATATAAKA